MSPPMPIHDSNTGLHRLGISAGPCPYALKCLGSWVDITLGHKAMATMGTYVYVCAYGGSYP